MGVYIKGMTLGELNDCIMAGAYIAPEDAAEVTEPHGRLIDADDVNERIRKKLGIRNLDYLLEVERPISMSIKESPTVIEAEGE